MGFLVDCKSQNCGYWDRSDLTMSYFDDIKDYQVLSSSEERKLLERVKSKNPAISSAARNKLVECNQRFVVSVARRWAKGDNLMDIVNEANIGLMQAIDNYDLSKNQRFITYAVWWIRKYINDYLVFKEKPVIPANALKLHTYVPKVKRDFFAKHGRYPTFDELRRILKKKYKVVVSHPEDLERLTMTSVDEAYFEPSERQSDDLTDFDMRTSSNNIDDAIDLAARKKSVEYLLSYLNEKEKSIIKAYYGIDCIESGLEVIGDNIGSSKERVRQIIESSLKKMAQSDKFTINNL